MLLEPGPLPGSSPVAFVPGTVLALGPWRTPGVRPLRVGASLPQLAGIRLREPGAPHACPRSTRPNQKKLSRAGFRQTCHTSSKTVPEQSLEHSFLFYLPLCIARFIPAVSRHVLEDAQPLVVAHTEPVQHPTRVPNGENLTWPKPQPHPSSRRALVTHGGLLHSTFLDGRAAEQVGVLLVCFYLLKTADDSSEETK